MKTTIDIADDLLEKAKALARRERKTMREIIEDALRQQFSEDTARRHFRLKRHPVKGKGLQSGISEGNWEKIRDLIYRFG